MTDNERVFPIERTATGGYRLREMTCWDCGGSYQLPYADHTLTPRHRAWKAAQRGEAQVSAFDAIPDESTIPVEDPARLIFGEVKVCPRCRGTIRPQRKDRKGVELPADTYSHDPIDKDGPCVKCKGTGVVQLEHT